MVQKHGIALIMAAILCGTATCQATPASAPPGTSVRRARLAEVIQFNTLLSNGKYTEAIDLARAAHGSAQTDADRVIALEQMSRAMLRGKDVTSAKSTLLLAQVTIDKSDSVDREFPALRPMILVARAQLAEFAEGNAQEAIALYDQAAAFDVPGADGSRATAVNNAIVLVAKSGDLQSAIKRADAMMSSDVGRKMGPARSAYWRLAIAHWVEESQGLDAAIPRYRALWESSKASNDPSVIDAGIRYAELLVPGFFCDQRLGVAHEILDKVNTLRAAGGSGAGAIPSDELDDIEQRVLVIIADSGDCPGKAAEAQDARAKLKGLYRSLQ